MITGYCHPVHDTEGIVNTGKSLSRWSWNNEMLEQATSLVWDVGEDEFIPLYLTFSEEVLTATSLSSASLELSLPCQHSSSTVAMVIKWSENSLMHANVMIRIETWSEKQFKASYVLCKQTDVCCYAVAVCCKCRKFQYTHSAEQLGVAALSHRTQIVPAPILGPRAGCTFSWFYGN